MRSRAVLMGGVLAAVLLAALLIGLVAAPSVRATRDPETGLHLVALAALPVEAQQTVIMIERGGPYRYSRDGAVYTDDHYASFVRVVRE